MSERLWKWVAVWAIRRLRRRLEHRLAEHFDAALSFELDRLVGAGDMLENCRNQKNRHH